MLVFALSLLLAASPTAARKPARPVTLTTAVADTVRQSILKDRSDTETWLRTQPTSYLATIQRRLNCVDAKSEVGGIQEQIATRRQRFHDCLGFATAEHPFHDQCVGYN